MEIISYLFEKRFTSGPPGKHVVGILESEFDDTLYIILEKREGKTQKENERERERNIRFLLLTTVTR